ncbi:Chitin synthase, class 7 [Tilletia horrida]|nr:Chitin synthase, class 7 [Tilletia horrida]KAK0560622.1 Chitin synthase, class 7 [Tilletia horrida]
MPMQRDDLNKTFIRRPGAKSQTAIPMRTEAPPPLRQPTRIGRSKTLTRPERSQPTAPLINPHGSRTDIAGTQVSWWTIFARVVTFWAPGPLLSAMGGLKDPASKQAWREKVALVFIAFILGGFVAFVTVGLAAALCPSSATYDVSAYAHIGSASSSLGVNGWLFNVSHASLPTDQFQFNPYTQAGADITPNFVRSFPSCGNSKAAYATIDPCQTNTLAASGNTNCFLGQMDTTTFQKYRMTNTSRKVGYDWDDIASGKFVDYIVVDGNVLNLQPYFSIVRNQTGDLVDLALRRQIATIDVAGGRDATRMFYTNNVLREALPCLLEKYFAGHIDKITPGCFISNLVLYMSLIVILGIVLIRFFMAVYFSWFLSSRMTAPPNPRKLARRKAGVPLHVMPEGAMTTYNSSGAAPWANKPKPPPSRGGPARFDSAEIGSEPYTVCLVTAYSENEEGISTTLTSLAETDYSDSRKLLFVVADGMVTGSGESISTPDVCVGLLEADPRFGTPMPMSFTSVASGPKAHNMAMVYAGHYTRGKGHRTPMIVVVKCGTPDEASSAKPGNRGKRDSQMILMNFFQRVTYNDRMTPLDFDLFRKMHTLMGVTPDFFELCMMVDADTMVYPRSLKTLAHCMLHDDLIMGACGETRIANKRASWVTAIQVYEYFISHHLNKAFESVFGGVTCLPGCFSMYRIKARKESDWVPIIVKPEVTREYSQTTVTTLHQKNLLLLGEDRFLTTLLLRTFPNRKMVFCPQARCRTEVPHTFKMLLSQRRRWINSTIHNLMELILVRDLCGTFCFSMQFVVFMDLLGTAVLPVALVLTYTLIATYCLHPPHSFTEAIPLCLLTAVIGLPALLILLATRKVVYVFWMSVWLIALPVWNFVLPVYSFWHFDDFSWGETRKVEGEVVDKTGHGGEAKGEMTTAEAEQSVPFRRWEDWERSRLRKLKREEKRRRDLEKQFGAGFYNDGERRNGPGAQDDGGPDYPRRLDDPLSSNSPNNRAGMGTYNQRLSPGGMLHRGDASMSENDTSSDAGTDLDEDRWGLQIGGYDETQAPPLMNAEVRHSIWAATGPAGNVIMMQDDMERMMEKGWDDDDDELSGSGSGSGVGNGNGKMLALGRPSLTVNDGGGANRRSYQPSAQQTSEYHQLMRGISPGPGSPNPNPFANGGGAGPMGGGGGGFPAQPSSANPFQAQSSAVVVQHGRDPNAMHTRNRSIGSGNVNGQQQQQQQAGSAAASSPIPAPAAVRPMPSGIPFEQWERERRARGPGAAGPPGGR